MDYTHHYDSPLGGITLASDGNTLTGLWFDGQKHFGSTLDREHTAKQLPVFLEAVRWLDIYFSGSVPDFTPELSLRGTVFRRKVWNCLLSVPRGATVTYGQIAGRLSQREGTGRISARAVGGAVARNPVSLIIPCHRVIGADGSLTGYAAGMEKKRSLLRMEGAL